MIRIFSGGNLVYGQCFFVRSERAMITEEFYLKEGVRLKGEEI